jgi:AmmeMemoRadiSam system protein B
MKYKFLFLMALLIFSLGLTIKFWPKTKNTPEISTIIVPHHDLVAKQRSDTFAKVAPSTQGRPIILLAPNHYNNGNSGIQTRVKDFQTQNGTVNINHRLVEIAKKAGAQETPTTFEIEHGVKALLSDIAMYYPDNSVLPIVVKEQSDINQLKELFNNLKTNCGNCLLITSADFSHYQPYQLSELHDKLTLRGLLNRDIDLLKARAELEPMNQTWLSAYWATLNNTSRFVLDKHTNSTELSNDFYSEGTTHIFGWYEKGLPTKPDNTVSFTFSGSINYELPMSNKFTPKNTTLFDQLGGRVIWGTDLSAGALINYPYYQKSDTNNPLSFNHYSHLLTKDPDQRLPKEIIKLDSQPEIITGNNQQIALISGSAENITIDRIQQNTDKNIIVYVYWGQETPDLQKSLAHKWVESGADLIVGVGLPNIDKKEIYQNRPIFYSLGEFVSASNESTESIVLTGQFTEKSIELHPVLIKNSEYKPILQRSTQTYTNFLDASPELKPFLIDERGGLLFSFSK